MGAHWGVVWWQMCARFWQALARRWRHRADRLQARSAVCDSHAEKFFSRVKGRGE